MKDKLMWHFLQQGSTIRDAMTKTDNWLTVMDEVENGTRWKRGHALLQAAVIEYDPTASLSIEEEEILITLADGTQYAYWYQKGDKFRKWFKWGEDGEGVLCDPLPIDMSGASDLRMSESHHKCADSWRL